MGAVGLQSTQSMCCCVFGPPDQQALITVGREAADTEAEADRFTDYQNGFSFTEAHSECFVPARVRSRLNLLVIIGLR